MNRINADVFLKAFTEEWEILKKDEDDGIEIGIRNNDGTLCPLIQAKWYGEDDYFAEEDEIRANIVSAAPDLYRACLEALDFIGFPEDSKALGLEPILAALKLQAALHKAEGKR